MTQLFDTARYDHNDEPGHRLHSIELDTTTTSTEAVPIRGRSWRLDDQTIAIGRKGIELAREALRKAIPDDTDAEHSNTQHSNTQHSDTQRESAHRKAA